MSTKKLQILGSFGNKIYVQSDEPVDALDGSLWLDLDATGAYNNSSVIVSDDGYGNVVFENISTSCIVEDDGDGNITIF